MQLATVFQTFNPAEAQLIASMIEAAGIPVHLDQEASSLSVGSGMTTGGVFVQVPEERAEEARALIET
ncbi:MAG: DUF2007 domain-containing protein, partial [Verrucomicrobiales bacterium]|nr:DUF2007 domain-containing protein [Verrucomicrobiales bacterium]